MLEHPDIDISRAYHPKRWNGLHFAAAAGLPEKIDELVHRGAEINAPDNAGKTPLELAIMNGHKEVVRELMSVPHISFPKNGPLFLAVSHGQAGVVEELLKVRGIKVNQRTKFGETALTRAAKGEYPDVVRALLTTRTTKVNWTDGEGNTPLVIALQNKRSEIAQILLDARGIDVNKPDRRDRTPLVLAAHNGDAVVVKILLESPRLKLGKDSQGLRALRAAERGKHDECADLIRSALHGR